MRDIAEHLHVSVNTVHKAITGKSGLSDELRARIQAYADEVGYRRNASASALSRRSLNALALLPSRKGEGRYFYEYLWRGLEREAQRVRELGISFEMVSFAGGGYEAALRHVLARVHAGERIDGVLAFSPANEVEVALVGEIADAGVAVELVMGDAPGTGRIGAVVADYRTSGELMAEQAYNLLRFTPKGSVLLLSGDGGQDAHRKVAQAFCERLGTLVPALDIIDEPGAHAELEDLRVRLRERLCADVPVLACSVFAVGSEVLATELRQAGLAGTLPVIGSDVYPESAEALRDGVFTNLVYKDPMGLARTAARTLVEYLQWGTRPGELVQAGDVELVFRSNLKQYL